MPIAPVSHSTTTPTARASSSAGFAGGAERSNLEHINNRRRNQGKRPLRRDPDLDRVARAWARKMAQDNKLAHRPNLREAVNRASDRRWNMIGENVGVGGSESSLWKAWLDSPPHRRNIDNGAFDSVGIGAYRDGNGRLWMCQVFSDFAGR